MHYFNLLYLKITIAFLRKKENILYDQKLRISYLSILIISNVQCTIHCPMPNAHRGAYSIVQENIIGAYKKQNNLCCSVKL